MRRFAAILLVALLATACGAPHAPAPPTATATARPIVVQGAMDVEIRKLAHAIENAKEEKVQAWTFWTGTIDGYPVVISKTLKGMSNAAAATSLAAERYQPIAIVNQGTAGGHIPDLHVYDIVIGTDSLNLGSFKTGFRARGRGSEVAEWIPLDLNRSEGSAMQDPNASNVRRYHADENLLAAARRASASYRRGRVVEGVIGSSDIWNSEIDRIQRFHETFGTTVEEMETASAAQIAQLSQIPFLGIRVVSNNIMNGGAHDTKTGEACQDFVYTVLKTYIGEQLKH